MTILISLISHETLPLMFMSIKCLDGYMASGIKKITKIKNLFKGSVSQELTGVQSGINQKVFL
jgi:hypothetical protein